MMARKWRIEELSVVADPWNLKLKPTKLNGVPLDTRCDRDREQDYGIAWVEFERRFETTKRTKDTK